ncbi:hypothetical protein ABAC460_10590 [Asticcacaulis sp. AC460]|uniref:ABC transporter permease n=1 Tax=Asticcacaulis sp. AC460 TaxID=1282360 RepID=UPI0003C40879|nr:ABC transporter permease [Asticcacaulis sp. AC460]ESQ90190.1 hypothetical protein ABAC460_10590 [Asticcacaulis sp. AC460]
MPKVVTAIASPLMVLALWWATAASGVFPSQILVSPERVVSALVETWQLGELSTALGATFYRLAVGFGAGTLLGLAYGVAAALFRPIEDYTLPFFTVIRTVPTIAFVPVLILFFGIGETFKILIVAKATFFPIALAAVEGVRGIPQRYKDVAQAWRLPLPDTLRKVIIPAALPDVVTGVRLGLGRSWGALVAAELIASEVGLGQMMELGRQMFRMDVVFVGVAITGLVGFGLDRVLRSAETRLSRWKAG